MQLAQVGSKIDALNAKEALTGSRHGCPRNPIHCPDVQSIQDIIKSPKVDFSNPHGCPFFPEADSHKLICLGKRM